MPNKRESESSGMMSKFYGSRLAKVRVVCPASPLSSTKTGTATTTSDNIPLPLADSTSSMTNSEEYFDKHSKWTSENESTWDQQHLQQITIS